jgi:hypothetical protein
MEGYQLGGSTDLGGPSYDLIMPLTVAQCQPVLIYYNFAAAAAAQETGFFDPNFILFTPGGLILVAFTFPNKVGYLEWICNIPANETFYAQSLGNSATVQAWYTVQPGPSTCLGPLTPSYIPDIYYGTVFSAYTATISPDPTLDTSSYNPPYVYPSFLFVYGLIVVRSTIPFPTGTFSTFTLKCEFFFGPRITAYLLSTVFHSHRLNMRPAHQILLLVALLASWFSYLSSPFSGSISGGIPPNRWVCSRYPLRACPQDRPTIPNIQDPSYGPPHEIPMDSIIATTPVVSQKQGAQSVLTFNLRAVLHTQPPSSQQDHSSQMPLEMQPHS